MDTEKEPLFSQWADYKSVRLQHLHGDSKITAQADNAGHWVISYRRESWAEGAEDMIWNSGEAESMADAQVAGEKSIAELKEYLSEE